MIISGHRRGHRRAYIEGIVVYSSAARDCIPPSESGASLSAAQARRQATSTQRPGRGTLGDIQAVTESLSARTGRRLQLRTRSHESLASSALTRDFKHTGNTVTQLTHDDIRASTRLEKP